MRTRTLLPVTLVCGLLGATFLPAQKQEFLASNDTGEITLTQPARVGELILAPGAYVVKSRDSGGRHLIRFIEVKTVEKFRVTRKFTGWYTETEQDNAGEVTCRLEPLGAKVQAASMTIAREDGTARITQVMIKGEDHVHICQE